MSANATGNQDGIGGGDVPSHEGETSRSVANDDAAASDESKLPSSGTSDAATKPKSFAVQLMNMLRGEAGGTAVQWLNDGRGFIIRDQQQFEQNILPTYFDSPCAFQSFLRRLYR